MKKIVIPIIVLYLIIGGCLKQDEPNGKWIEDNGYALAISHKEVIEVAKNWVKNEGIDKRYDFLYKIIEEYKKYYIYIDYISSYSALNDPRTAPGENVIIVVSKSREIIDVMHGE